jgi:hypothetical protein
LNRNEYGETPVGKNDESPVNEDDERAPLESAHSSSPATAERSGSKFDEALHLRILTEVELLQSEAADLMAIATALERKADSLQDRSAALREILMERFRPTEGSEGD